MVVAHAKRVEERLIERHRIRQQGHIDPEADVHGEVGVKSPNVVHKEPRIGLAEPRGGFHPGVDLVVGVLTIVDSAVVARCDRQKLRKAVEIITAIGILNE